MACSYLKIPPQSQPGQHIGQCGIGPLALGTGGVQIDQNLSERSMCCPVVDLHELRRAEVVVGSAGLIQRDHSA